MSLKSIIKKCVLAGGLAGSLLFSSCAKPQDADLEYRVVVDSKNPLDDFETNSNFWFSLNQLNRKSSNSLESENDTASDRVVSTFINYYISAITQHYAHEVSHNFIDRKYGEKHGFNITASDLNYSWLLPVPEVVQHPLDDWETVFSEEEIFNSLTFGLNTDEYNAKKYWKGIILNNNPHALDGLSYLVSKFFDMSYSFGVGFYDKNDSVRGLTMPELIDHIRNVNNTPHINDIDFYTLYLHNKGIDLSKRDYFRQILFSDLLSWQTWESFSSIFDYLENGTQRYNPFMFRIGDNEITPPLVSLYLTSDGSFFDFTSFVNPLGEHPIEVSVGSGGFEGDLNCLRSGIKIYNLGAGKFGFNPFVYSDTAGGYSLGTEITFDLNDNTLREYKLRTKLEYNSDDIMDRIKMYDNGFRLSGGLDVRF